MSQVIIAGDTSGTITLQAPAVAGSTTLTLPTTTATLATLTTPSFATTIGVGAATASASGAGISFPATQSASSDANTLDDYEEGTWTPSYTGSITNPTITQVTDGRYTKIGRFVFLMANMYTSAVTSAGSGDLRISGLPFAVNSSLASFGGSIGLSVFFNTNPGAIQAESNQTYISLYRNINNTVSPTTDLQAGTFNNTFRFSFAYIV